MKSIYLDLDQTIFNDVIHKVAIINRLALDQGFIKVPTYEEVLITKSISQTYDSYGIHEDFYEHIRKRDDYYRDMPLMENCLESLHPLHEQEYLKGYITARSLETSNITEEALLSLMIDDSVELYTLIKQKNNTSIQTILFEGPLTKSDFAMRWNQIIKILL